MHQWLAIAVFIVVVGHITYALRDPAALRSMLKGTISRRWAQRHAPAWVAEIDSADLAAKSEEKAVPGAAPSTKPRCELRPSVNSAPQPSTPTRIRSVLTSTLPAGTLQRVARSLAPAPLPRQQSFPLRHPG